MSATILLVDDDAEIRELLELLLAGEGYAVLQAESGEAALDLLEKGAGVDLIILDVMMPGLSGYKTCARIRETSNVPILFLTARGMDTDLTLGFSAGGDDYLSKPFSNAELLSRVKALLRRYMTLGTVAGAPSRPGVIRLGGLELDTQAKTLEVDGAPVRLTATEYRIVQFFMENPGHVFSASEIYEHVWNEPGFGVENTVMVHIRRIREKIEIDPKNPNYLKVVWGLGYKMEKI